MRIRDPHGIWGGMNEAERKQLLDRVSPISQLA
jgi:hypothetical protein